MTQILPSCIVVVAVIVASYCHGAEVLDQSNFVPPDDAYSALVSRDDLRAGQVITVGLTGKLSRVELGLFRERDLPEPAFVDIAKTLNGVPDFTPAGRLATIEVNPQQLPYPFGFPAVAIPQYTISLDFSSSELEFVAGDTFAIIMRASTNGYAWWTSHETRNPYAGGDAFHLFTFNNQLVHFTNVDTHFRTYMTVEVPEPSMFVVSVSAVLGLSLMRSRIAATGRRVAL